MPVYYFDAGGNCKFCERQNPTGIANNSGLTAITAASALNGGEIGYLDLQKVWNIGGVVRGRNDVVLNVTSNGTSGALNVSVASCEYYPVKIWYTRNGATWTLYTFNNSSTVSLPAGTDNHWGHVLVQTDYNRTYRYYRVACCDCVTCGDSSCFIAGSLVLMADFTWKPIEEIKTGDKVVGIDGKVNTVLAPYSVRLGNKRSIMTFPDRSLFWSGEHLLWVRNRLGEEYWGTNDYNQYCREKQIYIIDGKTFDYRGLTKKEPYIVTQKFSYAHINGWKKQEAEMDRSFGGDTMIYSMAVDGSHTYIVNGYVATGFVDDRDYDYNTIAWRGLKGG